MAKSNKILDSGIEDNLDTNNVSELKEEYCRVLFIDKYGFGFDFKGCGIRVEIDKEFDSSHISDYVTIQYESDIGFPDFKFNVKYE